MRAHEYVQLHALLLEIREVVETDRQVEGFERYDAQPVRPVHIHRSKAHHRRAIFLLLEGIDETIHTQDLPEAPA